jgi:hypothetical protein
MTATAWELVNWNSSAVVEYSPDSNDVSTEAEELLLLEAVTRKLLLEA